MLFSRTKSIASIALFFVLATTVVVTAYRVHQEYSLPHVIHNAYLVEIYAPGTFNEQTNQGTTRSDVATLEMKKVLICRPSSPWENKNMLKLFKTSARFHSHPSSLKPDYQVTVYTGIFNKKAAVTYNYIIATGELGSDNEWCFVPEKFRVWIQTLPKGPTSPYTRIQTPYATIYN